MEGWEPIGNQSLRYTATFAGNSHTITGLCINRPDTDYVGLFGSAGADAIIRNVGLAEVSVLGDDRVGGLVGRNVDGIITSSYATGAVTGFNSVGGLVGMNTDGGGITSSYAMGTVDGTDYVGGLVGNNYGSVTSSYAMGAVTGPNSVGGLVGVNTGGGGITSSYATGTVDGTDYAGGLVGYNDGSVTSSYATGDVTGNSMVGGLVGFNHSGAITASYATGDVSGEYSNVGGLWGDNSGTVTASYYSSAAVVLQGGADVPPNDYARSVVELARVPTADAPGIFESWAVDAAGELEDSGTAYTLDDKRIVWDFGTDVQYPVLCPVDADGDGYFASAEFGTQPRDIEGTYVDFSQPEFVVDEANGTAAVSVVMINAPDIAVDVSVLVSDGTALSPNDYTRGSGAVDLSFDSSSAVDFLTTATFMIPIIDDSLRENTETIALSLDADALPSGVTLAVPGTATVVIVDDELRSAYDADDDGLIAVHTVEQLNVIRYDLNGDGEIDDTTSNDPSIDWQQGGGLCSLPLVMVFCPFDDDLLQLAMSLPLTLTSRAPDGLWMLRLMASLMLSSGWSAYRESVQANPNTPLPLRATGIRLQAYTSTAPTPTS